MTVNALKLANSNPYSIAYLKGGSNNSIIKGTVEFFPWSTGTIIKLEVLGLPTSGEKTNNFFGFHIHEIGECKLGKNNKDFESAGGHYNPESQLHPEHVGDLPMIYSNNGYSFMLFYTSRFTPEEIVGKSVIIHSSLDDFKTQPSGNAGERIACGEIIKRRWMFS